jgi:hypothetical protein
MVAEAAAGGGEESHRLNGPWRILDRMTARKGLER